jgi:hypothetical protein
VLEITLTWVSGYRRSQKERQRTIYSLDHARSGPNLHSVSASPLSFRSRHHPAVLDYCLDRNDFHGVSRAEGPSQLTWMSASRTCALSCYSWIRSTSEVEPMGASGGRSRLLGSCNDQDVWRRRKNLRCRQRNLRSVCWFTTAFDGLRCHPLTCMLLN